MASNTGKPTGPGDKTGDKAYARPTPKVSRMKTAKTFTAAERAAFLASRPDLAKPD